MAITVNSIITNLNTYIGDTSNDRVSANERYEAITEATAWLLEELGNEHMVNTYEIDYYDGVHYYQVNTGLADLLVGADLRRKFDRNTISFARKSEREIAEEIAVNADDPAWAIERRDGDVYLVISYNSQYTPLTISSMDSTTDGGTWTAFATSDALNLTADSNEFLQGSGSLNFDVDVSQSVNNYATLYLPDATERDLSDHEDLSSFILDVYIPDVTYISSFTFYWGSDSGATPSTRANYWSATTTTDINGNAFSNGWNTIKVDWNAATATGSPDVTSVQYYEIRMSYTASQADDTDFRYDNFRIVRPEPLVFHYISWNVGTNSGGTELTAFTATSDIPFFSGRYDQYKYAVAHKAASIIFYSALRLPDQGAVEEAEAIKALRRYRKQFESSITREVKNWKIFGVNLRGRYKNRTRIR